MDSRDYLLFEFWKKSGSERNKFFTKRRYFRLLKRFDKEVLCQGGGKAFLYKKYSDFIRREWLLVDTTTNKDTIVDFFTKHKKVIVKPLSSEQGKGISISDGNDQRIIDRLTAERKLNPVLLEEICYNCEELERINNSSLNTLRIYTIVKRDGEIEIPSASLRCGCGDSVVDNWGAGGVGYPIDIERGVIFGPGADKKGCKHIVHPGTDIVMPGFSIPRFKDACDLARQVILKDKRVVYAGLDIAILPDRLELIEVNFPGGHDFLQALDQVGKQIIMKSIKL